MKMKADKKSFWPISWLRITEYTILFGAVVVVARLFSLENMCYEIAAAVIAVLITIVVTRLLLDGQKASDEDKEKSIELYKKKLQIYAAFNRVLWDIDVDNDSQIKKLRNMCMQQLVFVISKKNLENLANAIKDLIQVQNNKNVEPTQLNRFKSKITQILKEDLDITNHKDQDNGTRTIQNLQSYFESKIEDDNKSTDTAMRDPRPESISEVIAPQALSPESSQQTENQDKNKPWNNPRLQEIWEKYENQKIKCMHFIAWDNDIQEKALLPEKDPKLLCLAEWGESWRTERLKTVKNGDIIFLFYRGGTGYKGIYEAQRTIVYEDNDETKKKTITENGGEPIPYNEGEHGQYLFYEDWLNGATYVSDIEVKEVIVRKNSYNPIGTMRQTIARLREWNVEKILRYFDSADSPRVD